MPSTTSSVVSMVRLSSTVITPSLPTFFMASAMMPPICLSLLALIVPTCAIISPLTSRCSLRISSIQASTARSMPRLSPVGLAPAATVLTPSRKIACASTVAVVVPSPATSEVFEATSRTICAPMFSSGSRSSISLATVTPSLVMIGAPNFFSITALRPLGPSVIFTASARAFTPRKIAWREFSPVTICFAISHFLLISLVRTAQFFQTKHRSKDRLLHSDQKRLLLCGFCGAAQFGQDFLFAENEVFLTVQLDFRAAVLPEQNTIAGLDVERDQFALFALAGADSDHFAFHRLFFRRIRDDDAALTVSFSSIRFTITRSWSGVRLTAIFAKPPLVSFQVCCRKEGRSLALLTGEC